MKSDITLVRNCSATLIPAGDVVTLEKGTPVSINQALGGSVTVNTPLGLVRIAPEELDALGKEVAAAIAEKMQEGSASDGSLAGQPFSEEHVWEALKSCFDPEIPVNIVDLGLVYSMELKPLDGGKYHVDVQMTLTAQGCGMGPTIAGDAQQKIERLEAVETANVAIVWDPAWNPRMISEAGKEQLGLTD